MTTSRTRAVESRSPSHDLTRRAGRRWRSLTGGIVAATFVGVMATANEAHAGWYWVSLGVGCARQIAVGPDDAHPWITGCPNGNAEATGPSHVFYLTTQSGGSLIPTYQWNFDNFSALSIYVNLNGWIFATDAEGRVWEDDGTVNGLGYGYGYELPGGVWSQVASGAVGAFAATVSTTPCPQCQSPLPAGQLWYPAQFETGGINQGDYIGNTNIWGIGCGSNCAAGPFTGSNGSIYSMQSDYVAFSPATMSGWSRLPGAAMAVTMYAMNGPGVSPQATDCYETPFVLNSEGNIYYWKASSSPDNAENGLQGSWVQIPVPEPAVSISQDYMLGKSGTVYIWEGSSWNYQPLVRPNVQNGVVTPMKQIAAPGFASATWFTAGGRGDIGGGTIWGIDYKGNVYYTQYTYEPPVIIQ
jgi:hypothetical protein